MITRKQNTFYSIFQRACWWGLLFIVIFQPFNTLHAAVQKEEMSLLSKKDIAYLLSVGIFAFFFTGFVSGYKAGFLMQVLIVASFELLRFLQCRLDEPLRNFLVAIGFEQGGRLVSMTSKLLIVFVVLLIMMTINRVINFLFSLILLNHLNRVLGACLGLLAAAATVGCVFVVLESAKVSLPKKGLVFHVDDLVWFANKICPADLISKCKQLGTQLAQALS